MRRLRCGDQVFEPRVRPTGGGVEVTVGGQTLLLQLEPAGPGVALVREASGTTRRLHLAREGERVHLFWEGVVYTLTEEREGARPLPRPDGDALEAPMPGRVAAVKVSPGQPVGRGDELLVVEAMKMENALRSPRDGRVRAVHAAVGDMVGPGRVLVELEP
ncbi:MAG TPA: biotin/lipoyl-containing protein [Vicinamibacteria bacterium]|nr:biotin/lipoyl-containing protein [Vicinamibacteria bacterium]